MATPFQQWLTESATGFSASTSFTVPDARIMTTDDLLHTVPGYPDIPAGNRDSAFAGNHELAGHLGEFIRHHPFFILATANAQGDGDCSYKGREPLPDGGYAPLVEIVDADTLVFPDYAGNNLFNSLGNLIVHPDLTLLFVDFAQGRILKIEGTGSILDNAGRWQALWPAAKRCVMVDITYIKSALRGNLPKWVPVD